MLTDDLVEGWTGNLDYTILADGTPLDGTGMTVTLVLRDRAKGLVNVTGEVSWLSQSTGVVRYAPALSDLKEERSPYTARFKVTDGSGKDVYFPNAEGMTWKVRK